MSIGRVATRAVPIAIGLALLGFAVACFNYTKPETLQHHQAWAAEHDRPAPADAILWAGAGSAVTGAFVVGFFVARWTGPRAG